MRHVNRFAATLMVLTLLAACATLGIQPADTFNKQLAGGYVTVTTVRQLGASLVSTRNITPDDGENVLKQTDNARAGLDIARSLGPTAGKDKLASTLTILTGLQTYLAAKEHK